MLTLYSTSYCRFNISADVQKSFPISKCVTQLFIFKHSAALKTTSFNSLFTLSGLVGLQFMTAQRHCHNVGLIMLR